ncbi:sterol desaturase family protein [Eleftheria terrae]|uniref:sterol desaturase family protein n=1 Tax=Eleftheria terrae TaxID=1597781 RepID=UPI00263A8D20|nr:sterol desaturase family protein [Eleftheria terrae]WKB53563.1 sterol desaturase family protein [Eleftheria terrae]
MNALALPLALMLVLVLAEQLALKWRRGQPIPWLDLIFNLHSGQLVLWLFRGVEVAVFAWVAGHASLGWLSHWPAPALWLFTVLAWDLGFYCLHRVHHKIGWMWAIHVVHHQGEHFNLSLGIRNSWYSSLASIPFFLPLAVLGVPTEVFMVVSSVHYSIQFYNHNGWVGRCGWLEQVLVTPSHHRVHHGANPEYIDKNFGGTFLWWDRLFGTFQPALPEVPIVYGTPGLPASHNPFWASHLPVLRYLGWPGPRLRQQPASTVLGRLVGAGGIALFAVVIYCVHRQGGWPPGQEAVLFALVIALSLVLGGLSDGRPWAAPAWCVLGLALPLAFIGRYQLRDPFGCAVMLALGLHALALGAWWWRGQRRHTAPPPAEPVALPAGLTPSQRGAGPSAAER